MGLQFFADNGFADQMDTKLYFPADALQLKKVVDTVFFQKVNATECNLLCTAPHPWSLMFHNEAFVCINCHPFYVHLVRLVVLSMEDLTMPVCDCDR